MRRLRVAAVLALSAAAAFGQAAGRSLTFTMAREGGAAVHYRIQLDESTGRGSYQDESGKPEADAAAVPMNVHGPLLGKLMATVPIVKSGRCESHAKNIANTGQKTLEYSADGVVSRCTYNYSVEDRVNTATQMFEALAETMQYGGRLRAKLRFDRLGLDAELDGLQGALADGQALEAGNIRGVLQAIDDDDRVMERVRRKAERLLQDAGATSGG